MSQEAPAAGTTLQVETRSHLPAVVMILHPPGTTVGAVAEEGTLARLNLVTHPGKRDYIVDH